MRNIKENWAPDTPPWLGIVLGVNVLCVIYILKKNVFFSDHFKMHFLKYVLMDVSAMAKCDMRQVGRF